LAELSPLCIICAEVCFTAVKTNRFEAS